MDPQEEIQGLFAMCVAQLRVLTETVGKLQQMLCTQNPGLSNAGDRHEVVSPSFTSDMGESCERPKAATPSSVLPKYTPTKIKATGQWKVLQPDYKLLEETGAKSAHLIEQKVLGMFDSVYGVYDGTKENTALKCCDCGKTEASFTWSGSWARDANGWVRCGACHAKGSGARQRQGAGMNEDLAPLIQPPLAGMLVGDYLKNETDRLCAILQEKYPSALVDQVSVRQAVIARLQSSLHGSGILPRNRNESEELWKIKAAPLFPPQIDPTAPGYTHQQLIVLVTNLIQAKTAETLRKNPKYTLVLGDGWRGYLNRCFNNPSVMDATDTLKHRLLQIPGIEGVCSTQHGTFEVQLLTRYAMPPHEGKTSRSGKLVRIGESVGPRVVAVDPVEGDSWSGVPVIFEHQKVKLQDEPISELASLNEEARKLYEREKAARERCGSLALSCSSLPPVDHNELLTNSQKTTEPPASAEPTLPPVRAAWSWEPETPVDQYGKKKE